MRKYDWGCSRPQICCDFCLTASILGEIFSKKPDIYEYKHIYVSYICGYQYIYIYILMYMCECGYQKQVFHLPNQYSSVSLSWIFMNTAVFVVCTSAHIWLVAQL